jgi:hypothetical protein
LQQHEVAVEITEISTVSTCTWNPGAWYRMVSMFC